jgi:hypothetical protein
MTCIIIEQQKNMQDFDVNQRKIDESKVEEEQLFNPFIHKIGYSDNWECEKRILKGDIYFMKQYTCIKN